MNKIEFPEEIKGRVEKVVSVVNSAFGCLGEKEDFLAKGHLFSGDRLTLIATIFRNDQEKDLCSEVLKRACKETDADLFVWTAESWTVNLDQSEIDQFNRERANGQWRNLGNHPKAVEIMLFTAETKTGSWLGMSKINKTPEGKRYLAEPAWTESNNTEGRFTGILFQKPVLH